MVTGKIRLALACLIAFPACDQIFGIHKNPDAPLDAGSPSQDAPLDAPLDATRDARMAADAGVDAQLPLEATVGKTFYVAADAGDAGDGGCTQANPCSTIASGLAAAAASGGAGTPTVLVCGGTYVEHELAVRSTVRLLGGYDCAKWTHASVTTTIENGSASKTYDTLLVSGPAVRQAAVIDGFTIVGVGTSGNVGSPFAAVGVEEGAAPTISSNVIKGEMASLCDVESDGVRIQFGSPTLIGNTITSCGPLGKGVFVGGPSTVTVLGNTISGSQDLAPGPGVGSAGIYVDESSADAASASFTIAGNVIHGGKGNGANGVYGAGPFSMNLDANAIDVDASDCNGMGVYLGGTIGGAVGGHIDVSANRISGGSGCLDPATKPMSFGLLLRAAVGPTVTNNMIFGGTAETMSGAAVPNSATSALRLQGVIAPIVRYNTLVGGYSQMSVAISLSEKTTDARIEENILVGATGPTLDGGVALSSAARCDGGVTLGFGSVLHNALINAPRLLNAECPGAVYPTVREMASELDASVDANILVAALCPDAGGPCARVPACATPADCLMQVFAGWNGGAANLSVSSTDAAAFEDAACIATPGVGFTLGDATPCAISHGVPADAGPNPGGDLYGVGCRGGNEYSLGANQNTNHCTVYR